MKRWKRRLCGRTADRLEGVVEWLRKKSERPQRQRPLRLPTASELRIQEMWEAQSRFLANRLLSAIDDSPTLFKILSESPRPIHIRLPSDN